MQTKYFGTDGIRGQSNTNLMTPEMMIQLARAIAVANNISYKKLATIIIGKDTRLSGYMLELALTSSFISVGINVVLVGPMPTPGISMFVKSMRADIGIVISASHNPYFDNGIKIFNSTGYKISAEIENKIEQLMSKDLSSHMAPYDKLGKAIKLKDEQGRYIEHIKHSFPQHLNLNNLKLVVDCANGAAYDIAPKVFHELGAEVISYGINPNGFNINENCGVTSPSVLSKMVVEHKADLGIAFDGDADRLLIIDENGNVIDGDQLIAAIAYHMIVVLKSLNNNVVVTTIMSNLGLEQYLQSLNVGLVRTDVGDKNVVNKMQELKAVLGGESSGHIIIGEGEATGDGIKAALYVLAMYKETRAKKISSLLNKFQPTPQIHANISFNYKYFGTNVIGSNALQKIIQHYQDLYKNDMRILIRQSGTEPIIRLMVEGNNLLKAKNILSEIESKISDALEVITAPSCILKK